MTSRTSPQSEASSEAIPPAVVPSQRASEVIRSRAVRHIVQPRPAVVTNRKPPPLPFYLDHSSELPQRDPDASATMWRYTASGPSAPTRPNVATKHRKTDDRAMAQSWINGPERRNDRLRAIPAHQAARSAQPGPVISPQRSDHIECRHDGPDLLVIASSDSSSHGSSVR